jgi:hypothetical protein
MEIFNFFDLTWFMLAVVVAFIAFWVGWHARGFSFLTAISQNPDHVIGLLQKIKEINAEVEDSGMPADAIPMKIEEVNGQVYAYNNITGEFLAQAQTIYQVALVAAARHPGKKFWHPELKQDRQTA